MDFDPPGTFCGIPVYLNNARFRKRKGTAEDFTVDPDWFITGWYDSGSTTKKPYTYYIDTSNQDAALRPFNDITATSVDWWATSYHQEQSVITYQITGRYILFSVYKPAAYKTYLMQGDQYLFKGKGV